MHHNFKDYGPLRRRAQGRGRTACSIAQDNGETNTYGLFYLQERGQLFLGPGIKVYGGQIIGLHSRDNDLVVNPSKAKKLTNIRTTAADEKLFLTPAARLLAGSGAGVHQRRRAGRGDAQGAPPAQALPGPQRAQARREDPGHAISRRLTQSRSRSLVEAEDTRAPNCSHS